jgi:predicted neuraminidase
MTSLFGSCPAKILLALSFLALSTTTSRAEDDIAIERVFGPEVPGKYKHPAAIEELANGDLFLVYYGGEGEYEGDTAVFGARKRKGDTSWPAPKIIADTPFTGDGNPVIWQAPDGLVWLFYVVRMGETWSDSRIKAKVSRDGAETWSDSMLLTLQPGTMVRNRPIVLDNGDYLLPIYHETGEDTEKTGENSTSVFLRCDPKTHQWTEAGRIHSPKGNLQPGVVQLEDGRLIAYCRRAGDYLPTTKGWIVRSESTDRGKTWSEGVDSAFPNPNAAVDFLRLKNGHLLLVYNDCMYDRTPLAAVISTDGDKTYASKRNIKSGPGDFAYPYAIQSADGKIHLVFTSDERTVINHAVFDETAILNHHDVNP